MDFCSHSANKSDSTQSNQVIFCDLAIRRCTRMFIAIVFVVFGSWWHSGCLSLWKESGRKSGMYTVKHYVAEAMDATYADESQKQF